MSLPIEIDKIIIRKRHRKVNHAKVAELAESIKQIGLINPISLNRNTLLAGAHRLAAYKLLGEDRIPFAPCGINGDEDTNTLIEIDENLFRNELSAAEKAQHISERVDIMTRKKIPEKLKEVKDNYSKRQSVDDLQDSNKVYQKVAKGAERAASSEAKKDVANILGTQTSNINADINRHKAIVAAKLDQNDLEELNTTQYNRVASIAKSQGAEAAKAELEQQLTKPDKDATNKHNFTLYLKQDINVLVSARSIIKRRTPSECSQIESMFYEDAFESIDTLIDHMRSKLN
tara:strand:+ start:813 stop:1679 length:867 start_codon:yes stop_codon:yes gene_type:complete